MAKIKISKTDFTFIPSGYGHYKVTYESPVTHKKWTAIINDMEAVDNVHYEESPKIKDMEDLKWKVKYYSQK